MAKRQIKISCSDVRSLVREAIADKLGGVFSTDDPKAADAVRNDRDDYDVWYGEDWESKKNREDLANLIDKRASGENAELDPINDKKYMAGADMESEPGKEESERFDKPFGDLDDTENLWHGDPDLEEPEDDEDEIAGLNEKRQVRLNETQLREFISYSVGKILKEAMGRPIYDRHGEYDGYEYSNYGSDSMQIDFDPFDNDDMMSAFQSVFESGKYEGLSPEMFDAFEDGQYGEIWPIKVEVDYDVTEGMKGDGYLQPDDPDEVKVTGWNVLSDLGQLGPAANVVKDAIDTYFRDGYFDTDSIDTGGLYEEKDWDMSFSDRVHKWHEDHPIDHGKNKGVTAHFPGGTEFQPENPYKDMTWDEYCEAKRREREERNEKDKLHKMNYPDEEPRNLGKTFHSNNDKLSITSDDLNEMISKAVRNLMEFRFGELPKSYDAWRTRSPYDDDPYDMAGKPITEDDFMDMFYSSDDKDFMNWLKDFDQAVYQKALQSEESGEENAMNVALEELGWKEIASEYFDMKPVSYYPGDNDPDPREAMGLDEEMEDGAPQQDVQDRFPKKASGRFTMNTRRGLTDKYRVFVEKTDNAELLTDIFVYDERGKEWEPQAEYVVGIEEYKDGSWLPYWETFNGDVSIRALANCFGKVVKLWKKVGYLYEEDDEIPFRYGGDYMKGAPKGMF